MTTTIRIVHPDQVDVLHVALSEYLERCDPKHWRSKAAAESLLESLKESTRLANPAQKFKKFAH